MNILKEDSPILRGPAPCPPGIYRIEDKSMRGRAGTVALHLPSCLRHRLQRSGCFPALPYPPNRQKKDIISIKDVASNISFQRLIQETAFVTMR